MATQILTSAIKGLYKPDETREFPNGKIEIVHLGDVTIGRITLKPGWKWSRDVRPLAKTDLCREAHTQYVISGRLMVEMADGTRMELKPGDAALIAPDHDAYVSGDEPFVAIDFTGLRDYAKRPT